MNVKLSVKIVCYILTVVMSFWGMNIAVAITHSSFSHITKAASAVSETISADEHITEADVVYIPNLMNQITGFMRNNTTNTSVRWQDRVVLLFWVVGVFQQYLFYYQSAECKEDGQIFSCRTAIVDYIHLKDSGE